MKRWRVPVAGALAVVLLVAAYVIGFHQPRSSQIAELTAESDQLRIQQVSLQRTINALEKVQAREPAFHAALGLLDQLIPSNLAQPSLLAGIQASAQGAGVELTSVVFGDPKVPKAAPPSNVPGTVLVAMPLAVVVSGPFAGITDMLRRIEVGKSRAVLVGSVALNEGETGFPQLTATWSGEVYALLAAEDPLLVDPNAPSAKPAPATPPSPESS